MFVSLQRFKISFFFAALLFFASWNYFFGTKKHHYMDSYTLQDYAEDISKIYFDLGNFAKKRSDWKAAIKFYQTALNHRCNFHEAAQYLKVCLNQEHSCSHKLQV